MKTFLKSSVFAITLAACTAIPAQASDYKMKVRWDDSQTVAQNYDKAADRIELYCKIQIRRDAGVRRIDMNKHIDTCETQLLTAYVKSVGKTAFTEYHTERTNPSNLSRL